MCAKYCVFFFLNLLALPVWAEELSPVTQQQMTFSEYNYHVDSCTKRAASLMQRMADIQKGLNQDQIEALEKTPKSAELTDKLVIEEKKSYECLQPWKAEFEKTLNSQSKSEIIEDLSYQGYAVISKSAISGNFEGCSGLNFGLLYLEDGTMFECAKESPSSKYSLPTPLSQPETLIMKNASSGRIRLLIDKIIYDGTIVHRNH